MRKLIALLLCAAMLASLTCCKDDGPVYLDEPPLPDDDVTPGPAGPWDDSSAVLGNTSGNLQNWGIAAESDGWIYFRGEYGFIYKMKKDGSGLKQLNRDNSVYINVSGDWIYYCDFGRENKLYRMKTDGTGRKMLLNESVSRLHLIGDWLYFTVNGEISSAVARMRPDGSEYIEFMYGMYSSVLFLPEKLYFIMTNEYGNRLYEMDLPPADYVPPPEPEEDDEIEPSWEELNPPKMLVENPSSIYPWGTDVYYLSTARSSSQLYCFPADNYDATKRVFDGLMGCFNRDEGRFYFADDRDGGKLYSAKPDGSGKKKLTDFPVLCVCEAGGWLFALNPDEEMRSYKMKTDGKKLGKA